MTQIEQTPPGMEKMTTATAIPHIGRQISSLPRTRLERSLRSWNIALFISALLGAVSGLGGLVIGFISLVGLTDREQGLSILGTLLIVASFPLFILAAHCLDKTGEIDKAIRLEYCRQHGLNDGQ